MNKEDNVVALSNPAEFVADSLTELAKQGAQQMLAKALEAEVQDFLSHYGELGFWGALNEEFPKTKHQRCWVRLSMF